MNKILGSVLAGLVVLQGALPSLGITTPWANVAAVVAAVLTAALTFYLKSDTPDTASVGK